jgi:flagellar FliL protein
MAAKEPVRDEKDEDDDKKSSKGDKKPSPMKLVIVGALALFVAVLGAQVAAPLVTGMIAGKDGSHAQSGEQAAEGEDQASEEQGDEEEPIELAAAEEHLEPALYAPMDPPFVVSFADEGGETRFLQLTLQAMARNEKTIEAIKQHAPAIRNSFLFLISGYKVEELATLEGKEKLRAAMLGAANQIMQKNTGSAGIEELYFTSLVIQ